jgi:uncharacterized protein YndB with AHSA1/START domain
MDTETPRLSISRVFDAPRELVYQAFTDNPDNPAAWWGPLSGNELLEGAMHVSEAFAKLDAVLASGQVVAAGIEA